MARRMTTFSALVSSAVRGTTASAPTPALSSSHSSTAATNHPTIRTMAQPSSSSSVSRHAFRRAKSPQQRPLVERICQSWWIHVLICLTAFCLVLVYGLYAWRVVLAGTTTTTTLRHHQQQDAWTASVPRPPLSPRSPPLPPQQQQQAASTTHATIDSCQFRRYPPHRYYDVQQDLATAPDFLTRVPYLYGQWPQLVPTHSTHKLCVHQTEWRANTTTTRTTWPFADGTNPSLVSVERYQHDVAPHHQLPLDQPNHHNHNNQKNAKNRIQWIATVCMTNSQCLWKDSPAQIQEFQWNPNQTKPDTVRTLLLLLTDTFQTVAQATIYLHLDAPTYGKPGGKRFLRPQTQGGLYHLPSLDDARLFVHDSQLWISYREGKLFGYDAQVLNPLHLEWTTTITTTRTLRATIRASETTSFCCGRNMALLTTSPTTTRRTSDNQEPLQAVTWVDPMTVETVDTTPHQQQQQQQQQSPNVPRRLSNALPNDKNKKKKKKAATEKSHVHGTNAFMVYLPDRNEYLGVAHFHRPPDREANPYARFGHHYTHAFYTISATPPHRLATLSPEFVVPSVWHPTNAEVIQFASGLEYHAAQQELVLAYGINDCEAAVTRLDYRTVVDQWLRPVPQPPDGPQAEEEEDASVPQVVDFMKPLQRSV